MTQPTKSRRFSNPCGPVAAYQAARLWRVCMDEARRQGSVEARAVADLLSGLAQFIRQYEPDETTITFCLAHLLECTTKLCSAATDTVFVEALANHLSRKES